MNLLNNDPIEKSSCLLPQNVFLLSGNILYQVEELYEKMLNIPPDFRVQNSIRLVCLRKSLLYFINF